MYLFGVPLYVGRMKIWMFDPLLAKVLKKLAGWKSKLLSFGGKIILLKHVLNSILIYMLSVLNLPKGIFWHLKGCSLIFYGVLL